MTTAATAVRHLGGRRGRGRGSPGSATARQRQSQGTTKTSGPPSVCPSPTGPPPPRHSPQACLTKGRSRGPRREDAHERGTSGGGGEERERDHRGWSRGWMRHLRWQELCVFVLREGPPRPPLMKSGSARKRFANPTSGKGTQQKKS